MQPVGCFSSGLPSAVDDRVGLSGASAADKNVRAALDASHSKLGDSQPSVVSITGTCLNSEVKPPRVASERPDWSFVCSTAANDNRSAKAAMSNCFGMWISTASAFEEEAPWPPLLLRSSSATTSSPSFLPASSINMGSVAGFTLCKCLEEAGGCKEESDLATTTSCEVRIGCLLGVAACKLRTPRILDGYLAAPLLVETHQLLSIKTGLVDRCRRPKLEVLRLCHGVGGLVVRARAFASTRVGVRLLSAVTSPGAGVSDGAHDRLGDIRQSCGPGLSDLAKAGGLKTVAMRGAWATRGLLMPPTNLKVTSRDVSTGDCNG